MQKWLEINTEKCIACGMCAAVYPQVFDEDLLGYAFVKEDFVYSEPLNFKIIELIKNCPVHAIKIKSKP